MLAAALILAGCATPAPAPSAFAQCVDLVAGKTTFAPDRLRAAEWCAKVFP
jgi:hypothetical protein